MLQTPIFLDNNSTTAVDQKVLDQMMPYFSVKYGNAASRTHAYGWVAEEAVSYARARVAELIGASSDEIIFTSGSTESANLAIKGVAEAYASKGNHLVVSQAEHKAVLDTASDLEKKGFPVTWLPVSGDGLTDPDMVRNAIRPETILVAVMAANNETGVIQPVDEIGNICNEKGVIFFCDATQAAGKIRIDVNEMMAGLLCISAHKMYGPKGTGALYVRRKNPRVKPAAQIHGGGHELGLRSGTLNVPAIVGFGESCRMMFAGWWDHAARTSAWRTRLEQGLMLSDEVYINGSVKNRLPNTTNLMIKGVPAASLISVLPELAFSAGSACSSANPEPSHVLLAMGRSAEEAGCSVRFSLGKNNTEEEIIFAMEMITAAIKKIRSGV